MPPLERLAGELDVLAVSGDAAQVTVSSVTHDSRHVEPGALFCCVPGRQTDGHDHAAAAVGAGAVALLCERTLPLDVPQVVVADTRLQMGRAAAAFHDHPSRALPIVGVTGTNGKTTTTYLLAAVLEADGRPTEVIGTLSGARTTPESTELQAHLAEARDGGARAVAMEVSSHAIALHRIEGTELAVAVFTNLGRDHLDFHTSQEDYFATKARLFEPSRTAVGVVNVDDPHGRLLRDAARVPTRTFSLSDVSDLEVGLRESRGTWRGQRLRVPFGGAFNVSNALAAATAALELGVSPEVVVEGLARAEPVPGRFEVVATAAPATVVVDYAHTPEGLEQLLRAARQAAAGARVAVVFGCGGDRDREKRPMMGAIAAREADIVVFTSDNPRSEDPFAILDEVLGGTRGAAGVEVELDRRTAIARALALTEEGDVVVVAGKGHETTQVARGVETEFDDRVVAAEEAARIFGRPGNGSCGGAS